MIIACILHDTDCFLFPTNKSMMLKWCFSLWIVVQSFISEHFCTTNKSFVGTTYVTPTDVTLWLVFLWHIFCPKQTMKWHGSYLTNPVFKAWICWFKYVFGFYNILIFRFSPFKIFFQLLVSIKFSITTFDSYFKVNLVFF